jgi:Protein of unknown function (DUF2490)
MLQSFTKQSKQNPKFRCFNKRSTLETQRKKINMTNYHSTNLVDLIDLYIFVQSKQLKHLILKPFFVFLLSFCFFAKAQNKVIAHQNVYWLRYYNQLAFSPKLVFHTEFDNRKSFGTNQQQQAIFHARLFYQLPKNTEIAGGITYSRQSQAESPTHLVVPEFRANQLATWTIPTTKRLAIQHRIWIEDRFQRHHDGKVLLEGYDFSLRFRYRLQAAFQLNKPENKLKTIAKISDELMLNAGKKIVYNYFDQNRFSVSIEQNINKNLSFETQYFRTFQQKPAGNQFASRNVLRLTLYHKIFLIKK